MIASDHLHDHTFMIASVYIFKFFNIIGININYYFLKVKEKVFEMPQSLNT